MRLPIRRTIALCGAKGKSSTARNNWCGGMSALQKLTTEHTEYTERVRFMNKRIILGHWAYGRNMFTTLRSMKDKIIFSLCDLRGLCGGKITFLQWSQGCLPTSDTRQRKGILPA